jgi:hypothetical protein
LPGRKLPEVHFALSANPADCREPSFEPEGVTKQEADGRLTFSHSWKDEPSEGDVIFTCAPAQPRVQAVSGRQGDNGPRYFYARVLPNVPIFEKGQAFASHAVFLLDTSQSEHPERFAVSMKLLRKILATDPEIRFFNVLTFNVGAAWVEPAGWLPNTAQGREKLLARLDGLLLEGATDLSCALNMLCKIDFGVAPGTPINCFLLSDGHLTWGETDAAALVARFYKTCPFPVRFHCYRTGLGEENAELFEALTRRGGGSFLCYSEADLAPAAQAHRRECLVLDRIRFVGANPASDVLVDGRRSAVYPGGELVVAGRFAQTGRTTLVVEGTFRGQKVVEEFPLEVRDTGELAPRAWAEVAVASLLTLYDDTLDPLVTAYCQQFGIASRVASFLVLENEADYKRLNLEAEGGRILEGDLGDFVEKAWINLGKQTTPREDLDRFLRRAEGCMSLKGDAGRPVRELVALLREEDLGLPQSELPSALSLEKDAFPSYLARRQRDRGDVAVYLAEAQRRAQAGDVGGAVRVLSSVVEEHPGRGDALRLVGYRLLDLGQAAYATRLFRQVQTHWPFEAHSYRDLARALEEAGRPALAAVQYEILLAGTWHNRFGESLKEVAREEYAGLLRASLRQPIANKEIAAYFRRRIPDLAPEAIQEDLRVTISWNTDATDVDLWVIEPDGTKVFYSRPHSAAGGELSKDQTQGYGPERYHIAHARPGTYQVLVHYFRTNPNLLGGETHVRVTVTNHAGTAQETTRQYTVLLKQRDEQVEVCKIKF